MRPLKPVVPVLFFLLLILPTPNLSAGELQLNNGDRIQGELTAVGNDHIIWASSIFGAIKIPKTTIKKLSSTSVLNLVKTDHADSGTLTSDSLQENCSLKVEGTTTAKCDSGHWHNVSLDDVVSIIATPEPDPFSGEVKFGYNQKSGNSDSEELDVALSTLWRQDKFLHELDITIESDSADGEVVDEQYKTNYQLNYDLNDHWFSYGRGKYEKTRFSAIDEQFQLGAGLGYRLALINQLKLNMQL